MGHLAGRHPRCDRTRSLAALEVDGELSQLDAAFLDRHVERCDECRAFRARVAEITHAIRTTPHERPAVGFGVAVRRHAPRLVVTAARANALRAVGAAAVAVAFLAFLLPARTDTGGTGETAATVGADSSSVGAILGSVGGVALVSGVGGGGDLVLIS